MPQGDYLPEGMLIGTERNKEHTRGSKNILKAMAKKTVLEGVAVMCDRQRNLSVDMGGESGYIPREEAAVGLTEGRIRDIAVISKVGKPICFEITGRREGLWLLSRRAVQQKALDYFMDNLQSGDVIKCTVTHLEPFGAFVDIGCGNISMIGIENISVSRITHPSERFREGQKILAVVTGKDRKMQRVSLSHKELLGTWEENAERFASGQAALGIVRGVEDYGVFVELSPNLSGLAEKKEGLRPGDPVSVYIKSMIPDKMKVKLVIIDRLPKGRKAFIKEEDYFIRSGNIKEWIYSPACSQGRVIESRFGAV